MLIFTSDNEHISFLLYATIMGKKKQNKIQFTCICHQSIASATQKQEIEMKDASY